MKVVFPCKGSIVLTKSSINELNDFYVNNLINNKLYSVYNQSNYSVQVGAFNYFPKNSTITLENAHFLTLENLYKSIDLSKITTSKPENLEPLDDNFIINHPFFRTLTPLN